MAVILVVAMTGQDVLWAAPAAPDRIASWSAGRGEGRMPALGFELPAAEGFVDGGHLAADAGGKTVLVIEDAHANPSAQFNTARILKRIMDRSSVGTVYTEGAHGDVTLSVLAGGADVDPAQAESQVRKARMSGFEYADLLSPGRMRLHGVEDEGLYDQALELYRKTAADRDQARRFLDRVDRATGSLAEELWTRQLRDLWAERSAHDAGGLSTVRYFERVLEAAAGAGVPFEGYRDLKMLRRLVQEESSIDLQKVFEDQSNLLAALSGDDLKKIGTPDPSAGPSGQLAYWRNVADLGAAVPERSELAKYLAHLGRCRDLDATAVTRELGRIETEVFRALTPDADARALWETRRRAETLRAITMLEADPEDLAAFEADPGAHTAAELTAFINARIHALGRYYDRAVFLDEDFDRTARTAIDFYELSARRDAVMAAALEEQMTRSGESRAVLVAGGFHAPGLARELRRRGVSYLLLVPASAQPTDMDLYEKRLLSQSASMIHRPVAAAGQAIPRVTRAGLIVRPLAAAARMADAEALRTFDQLGIQWTPAPRKTSLHINRTAGMLRSVRRVLRAAERFVQERHPQTRISSVRMTANSLTRGLFIRGSDIDDMTVYLEGSTDAAERDFGRELVKRLRGVRGLKIAGSNTEPQVLSVSLRERIERNYVATGKRRVDFYENGRFVNSDSMARQSGLEMASPGSKYAGRVRFLSLIGQLSPDRLAVLRDATDPDTPGRKFLDDWTRGPRKELSADAARWAAAFESAYASKVLEVPSAEADRFTLALQELASAGLVYPFGRDRVTIAWRVSSPRFSESFWDNFVEVRLVDEAGAQHPYDAGPAGSYAGYFSPETTRVRERLRIGLPGRIKVSDGEWPIEELGSMPPVTAAELLRSVRLTDAADVARVRSTLEADLADPSVTDINSSAAVRAHYLVQLLGAAESPAATFSAAVLDDLVLRHPASREFLIHAALRSLLKVLPRVQDPQERARLSEVTKHLSSAYPWVVEAARDVITLEALMRTLEVRPADELRSALGPEPALMIYNRGWARVSVGKRGPVVKPNDGSLREPFDRILRAAGSGIVLGAAITPEEKVLHRAGAAVRTSPEGWSVYMDYPQTELKGFDSFSNGYLWPTMHDMRRGLGSDPSRSVEGFRRVNRRFAERAAQLARTLEGPRIIVQDYHLLLTPFYLKRLGTPADLYIAHTPWSSADYLESHVPGPLYRELVSGPASAGAVSFFSEEYRKDFIDTLERSGVPEGDRPDVVVNPISVDQGRVRGLTMSVGVLRWAAGMRRWLGNRVLIARGERTEPTKGTLEGFRAFYRYLRSHPGSVGRTVFYAWLVPSRLEMPSYARYLESVKREVRRINREFTPESSDGVIEDHASLQRMESGTPPAAAVILLPSADWTGVTLAADVFVGNSLRDGMNLVAMIYAMLNQPDFLQRATAAARRATRRIVTFKPAALVVSKTMGSYATMDSGAIGVDPNDPGELESAIEKSVAMTDAERLERARAAADQVSEFGVDGWAQKVWQTASAARMAVDAERSLSWNKPFVLQPEDSITIRMARAGIIRSRIRTGRSVRSRDRIDFPFLMVRGKDGFAFGIDGRAAYGLRSEASPVGGVPRQIITVSGGKLRFAYEQVSSDLLRISNLMPNDPIEFIGEFEADADGARLATAVASRGKDSDELNQDSFLEMDLGSGWKVLAVFDGVGGSENGAAASQAARDGVQKYFEDPDVLEMIRDVPTPRSGRKDGGTPVSEIPEFLTDALRWAQDQVRPIARGDAYSATTALIALVRSDWDADGNAAVWTLNYGDCQAALWTPSHPDRLRLIGSPNMTAGLAGRMKRRLKWTRDYLADLDDAKVINAINDLEKEALEGLDHGHARPEDRARLLDRFRKTRREGKVWPFTWRQAEAWIFRRLTVAIENGFAADVWPSGVEQTRVPPGGLLMLYTDGIGDTLTRREIARVVDRNFGASPLPPFKGDWRSSQMRLADDLIWAVHDPNYQVHPIPGKDGSKPEHYSAYPAPILNPRHKRDDATAGIFYNAPAANPAAARMADGQNEALSRRKFMAMFGSAAVLGPKPASGSTGPWGPMAVEDQVYRMDTGESAPGGRRLTEGQVRILTDRAPSLITSPIWDGECVLLFLRSRKRPDVMAVAHLANGSKYEDLAGQDLRRLSALEVEAQLEGLIAFLSDAGFDPDDLSAHMIHYGPSHSENVVGQQLFLSFWKDLLKRRLGIESIERRIDPVPSQMNGRPADRTNVMRRMWSSVDLKNDGSFEIRSFADASVLDASGGEDMMLTSEPVLRTVVTDDGFADKTLISIQQEMWGMVLQGATWCAAAVLGGYGLVLPIRLLRSGSHVNRANLTRLVRSDLKALRDSFNDPSGSGARLAEESYVRIGEDEARSVMERTLAVTVAGKAAYLRRFFEPIRAGAQKKKYLGGLIGLMEKAWPTVDAERLGGSLKTRLTHLGIVRSESDGSVWIIKTRERGRRAGEWKNDVRRERLMYLLAERLGVPAAEVRALTARQAAALGLGENEAKLSYLVRVVNPDNFALQQRTPSPASNTAGIWTLDLLTRRYDHHLDNYGFTGTDGAGSMVAIDLDEGLKPGQFNDTDQSTGLMRYTGSHAEHAILTLFETLVQWLDVQSGMVEQDLNRLYGAREGGGSVIKRWNKALSEFIKKYLLFHSFLAAEDIDPRQLADSIAHFKSVLDRGSIEQMAAEAGYEGDELTHMAGWLEERLGHLGRDADEYWSILSNEPDSKRFWNYIAGVELEFSQLDNPSSAARMAADRPVSRAWESDTKIDAAAYWARTSPITESMLPTTARNLKILRAAVELHDSEPITRKALADLAGIPVIDVPAKINYVLWMVKRSASVEGEKALDPKEALEAIDRRSEALERTGRSTLKEGRPAGRPRTAGEDRPAIDPERLMAGSGIPDADALSVMTLEALSERLKSKGMKGDAASLRTLLRFLFDSERGLADLPYPGEPGWEYLDPRATLNHSGIEVGDRIQRFEGDGYRHYFYLGPGKGRGALLLQPTGPSGEPEGEPVSLRMAQLTPALIRSEAPGEAQAIQEVEGARLGSASNQTGSDDEVIRKDGPGLRTVELYGPQWNRLDPADRRLISKAIRKNSMVKTPFKKRRSGKRSYRPKDSGEDPILLVLLDANNKWLGHLAYEEGSKKSVYLSDLAVKRDRRGRHLGTRLMDALFERLRSERRVDRVQWMAAGDSMEFYQKYLTPRVPYWQGGNEFMALVSASSSSPEKFKRNHPKIHERQRALLDQLDQRSLQVQDILRGLKGTVWIAGLDESGSVRIPTRISNLAVRGIRTERSSLIAKVSRIPSWSLVQLSRKIDEAEEDGSGQILRTLMGPMDDGLNLSGEHTGWKRVPNPLDLEKGTPHAWLRDDTGPEAGARLASWTDRRVDVRWADALRSAVRQNVQAVHEQASAIVEALGPLVIEQNIRDMDVDAYVKALERGFGTALRVPATDAFDLESRIIGFYRYMRSSDDSNGYLGGYRSKEAVEFRTILKEVLEHEWSSSPGEDELESEIVRYAVNVFCRIILLQSFENGNHRIADFVMNYIFAKNGLPTFVLTPSNVIEYYQLFNTDTLREARKIGLSPQERFIRREIHQPSPARIHASEPPASPVLPIGSEIGPLMRAVTDDARILEDLGRMGIDLQWLSTTDFYRPGNAAFGFGRRNLWPGSEGYLKSHFVEQAELIRTDMSDLIRRRGADGDRRLFIVQAGLGEVMNETEDLTELIREAFEAARVDMNGWAIDLALLDISDAHVAKAVETFGEEKGGIRMHYRTVDLRDTEAMRSYAEQIALTVSGRADYFLARNVFYENQSASEMSELTLPIPSRFQAWRDTEGPAGAFGLTQLISSALALKNMARAFGRGRSDHEPGTRYLIDPLLTRSGEDAAVFVPAGMASIGRPEAGVLEFADPALVEGLGIYATQAGFRRMTEDQKGARMADEDARADLIDVSLYWQTLGPMHENMMPKSLRDLRVLRAVAEAYLEESTAVTQEAWAVKTGLPEKDLEAKVSRILSAIRNRRGKDDPGTLMTPQETIEAATVKIELLERRAAAGARMADDSVERSDVGRLIDQGIGLILNSEHDVSGDDERVNGFSKLEAAFLTRTATEEERHEIVTHLIAHLRPSLDPAGGEIRSAAQNAELAESVLHHLFHNMPPHIRTQEFTDFSKIFAEKLIDQTGYKHRFRNNVFKQLIFAMLTEKDFADEVAVSAGPGSGADEHTLAVELMRSFASIPDGLVRVFRSEASGSSVVSGVSDWIRDHKTELEMDVLEQIHWAVEVLRREELGARMAHDEDNARNARVEGFLSSEGLAAVLIQNYTMDPDAATRRAADIRKGQWSSEGDEHVLRDSAGHRAAVVTQRGTVRYLDSNERWILTIDPNGNKIDELEWDAAGKFKRAWTLNTNFAEVILEPDNPDGTISHIRMRVQDRHGIREGIVYDCEPGLDLDHPENVPYGELSWDSTILEEERNGFAVSIFRMLAILVSDLGSERAMRYTGDIPSDALYNSFVQVAIPEMALPALADRGWSMIDHAMKIPTIGLEPGPRRAFRSSPRSVKWHPEAPERIFNREDRVSLSFRSGNLERAYYGGVTYKLSQFHLGAISGHAIGTLRPLEDGTFELLYDRADRRTTMDASGKVLNTSVTESELEASREIFWIRLSDAEKNLLRTVAARVLAAGNVRIAEGEAQRLAVGIAAGYAIVGIEGLGGALVLKVGDTVLAEWKDLDSLRQAAAGVEDTDTVAAGGQLADGLLAFDQELLRAAQTAVERPIVSGRPTQTWTQVRTDELLSKDSRTREVELQLILEAMHWLGGQSAFAGDRYYLDPAGLSEEDKDQIERYIRFEGAQDIVLGTLDPADLAEHPDAVPAQWYTDPDRQIKGWVNILMPDPGEGLMPIGRARQASHLVIVGAADPGDPDIGAWEAFKKAGTFDPAIFSERVVGIYGGSVDFGSAEGFLGSVRGEVRLSQRVPFHPVRAGARLAKLRQALQQIATMA